MKFLWALGLLISTSAWGSLDSLTLLVRAGAEPYGLPHGSILSNTNPQAGASGQVFFKYWGYDDVRMETDQRIWRIGPDSSGEFARHGGDWLMSDPFVTADQQVLYTLSDFGLFGGGWRTVQNNPPQLILDPKEMPEVMGVSSFAQLSNGQYLWRSTTNQGRRQLERGRTARDREVMLAEGDEFFDWTITYVFSPVGAGERIALKLRLERDNQERMVLALFEHETWRVVFADGPGLPNAFQVGSLHNNLALTEGGKLAVLGKSKSGQPAVLVADGVQQHAHTALGSTAFLETFAPAMNDQGLIAFRATDVEKRRGLYLLESTGELRLVVREGDLVPLEDQGTARVLWSDWGPGFAGAPTMTQDGEVIFSAVLEEKEGGQRLGSALYRLD